MAFEVWFPNLGIKIEKLSRQALSVFGFEIYWYGVIIGMSILLAWLLVLHEAKRTNQSPEEYMDFGIVAIILSIIGARLYYVIFSWSDYQYNLIKIFATREGGLAIYGAVLAGILSGIVYARIKKKDIWLMADTVLPSLLLGQALGRWGNFFNREAFGGHTEGLFAMRYIKDQVHGVAASVLENTVLVEGIEYIQVHPTFLYESLWSIGLLIILLVIRRKYKKFDGQVGILYAIGYGLGRLWIEELRTDQLLIGSTNIAVSQVVSVLMIAVGLALYLWRQKLALESKKIAG